MKTALVLLAGTLITYGLGKLVAGRYGDQVRDRFVETSTSYTPDSLARWVASSKADAEGYACPTLFPVDLLFMAFLAGLLGFVSVRAAVSVAILREAAPWFVALPALYLAVDLAEDAVLATLLTVPASITATTVTALHALTQIKIWSVTAALAQTVLLIIVGGKAMWR
jgi:hypothetical protein